MNELRRTARDGRAQEHRNSSPQAWLSSESASRAWILGILLLLGLLSGVTAAAGKGSNSLSAGNGACVSDLDCSDGIFCNGSESCVRGTCEPGPAPCPGDSCNEGFGSCGVGEPPRLEAGSLTVGSDPVTVPLGAVYRQPVVVASAHYDGAAPQLSTVVRIGSVTSTSFRIWLQPAANTLQPPASERVSYLVVEAGAWSLNGLAFEAQRFVSRVTDGMRLGGERRAFLQSYLQPVVLGQVMSANDPRWSVFWAAGSTTSEQPAWNGLRMGKTVGEDPQGSRQPEEIGFIVFEAGHGSFGSTEFEAGVTALGVGGLSFLAPTAQSFAQPFPEAPEVMLVGLAGITDPEGGWAELYGETASGFQAFVEEDQLGDGERSHGPERVAYLAFDQGFQQAGAPFEIPDDPPFPDLLTDYALCEIGAGDFQLGCSSSAYFECLGDGIDACEAGVNLCADELESVATGCAGCFGSGWRLRSPFALLSCTRCAFEVLEYIECLDDVSFQQRLKNSQCKCDFCDTQNPTCTNRYDVNLEVTGLRCGEAVAANVLCQSDSTPATFMLSEVSPTSNIPNWCSGQDDWSVTIGTVMDLATNTPKRSCTPSQRSGAGTTHIPSVTARFDCSCSGASCGDSVQPVVLTGSASCMAPNDWFSLDVEVTDPCGQPVGQNQVTVTESDTFFLGIDAVPGSLVKTTIVDSSGGCFNDPFDVQVPAETTGTFNVTHVSCDSSCGGEVDVNVRVMGFGAGLDGGVQLELFLDGQLTSTNTSAQGVASLGRATTGQSYAVGINNPVVVLPAGAARQCQYTDLAGGVVPGTGPVTLGRVECSKLNNEPPPCDDCPDGMPGSPAPLPPLPLPPGSDVTCEQVCPPPQATSVEIPCDPSLYCNGNEPCYCEAVSYIFPPCFLVCTSQSTVITVDTPDVVFSLRGDHPTEVLIANQKLRVGADTVDDVGLNQIRLAIDDQWAGFLELGGAQSATTFHELDTSQLGVGTHRLTAAVYDEEGGWTALYDRGFVVQHAADPCVGDDTGPVLEIVSHSDGQQIPPGQVTLITTGTDSGSGISQVTYLIDGVEQHSDSSSPYTFSNWWPGPGQYTVTARGRDFCGNQSETSITLVVVDPSGCTGQPEPSVEVTNLQDGSWLPPGLYHLEASATDHSGSGIDRVEFQVGSFDPWVDSGAPFESNGYWLTNQGPVPIEVRVWDGCGRMGTESLTIHIEEDASVCSLDTADPWTTIALPAHGETVSEGAVEVVANAGDDTGLMAATLQVDGTVPEGFTILSADPTDYRWTWQATPGTHTLRVAAMDQCNKVGLSAPRTVTVTERPTCNTGGTKLCLLGGRFEVTLDYPGGSAKALSRTDKSGALWFNNPSSIEALVKILDGRAQNGSFWVYHGALTDQGYTLTVKDLWENLTRVYQSPGGDLCGGSDNQGFPSLMDPPAGPLGGSSGAGSSGAGACVPTPKRLCLNGKRFAAEVRYRNPSNPGQMLNATKAKHKDRSGTFWFFDPANEEVGVKIIDGSAQNGHFWVLHGGATDIHYEVTVTDTQTGASKTYVQAAGSYCGSADTQAF